MRCVWSRYDWVRGKHQQRTHTTILPQRVQQLVGGTARPRQCGRVDAPNLSDMFTMKRVVKLTIPRQLVGFLTVLAPTLPVALTSQAAIARVRLPNLAKRQRKIDERLGIIDTFALLLRAARRHNHGRLRATEHL